MDGQNLQNTGGGESNKNDYQPTISGQSLTAAPTNLQNSSSSALSGNDKKLSSVGSSQFIPVPKSTSTSTVAQSTSKPTDTMPFLLSGLLIFIIVSASLLITNLWVLEPPKPPSKKQAKKT